LQFVNRKLSPVAMKISLQVVTAVILTVAGSAGAARTATSEGIRRLDESEDVKFIPSKEISQLRRRLSESSSVDQLAAEKACAQWGEGKDDCVFDVLTTGGLEMAVLGAYIQGSGRSGNANEVVGVERKLDIMSNAEVAVGTTTTSCMKDYSGKNQVCTANDVRLASARNIAITDGGCFGSASDTVTFSADFEIVLTAQARYDIGVWFSTDGDPNSDGALTGQCTVATPAFGPEPDFVNLDAVAQPTDICGEIDSAHSPMFQRLNLTVVCVSGANNKLNIPYCTSWRQPGANDLCTDPTQAFPGTPSKCKCDQGFTVDIFVPGVTCADTPSCANSPGPCTIKDCRNDTTFDPPELRCFYDTVPNESNTTCDDESKCTDFDQCVDGYC
jgi:hypothetical protein